MLGWGCWARSWRWGANEIFGSGERIDKSAFDAGIANFSEARQVPWTNEVHQVWALVSCPSHGPTEGTATPQLWKIILWECNSSVARSSDFSTEIWIFTWSLLIGNVDNCISYGKRKWCCNKYISKYSGFKKMDLYFSEVVAQAGGLGGWGPAELHVVIQGLRSFHLALPSLREPSLTAQSKLGHQPVCGPASLQLRSFCLWSLSFLSPSLLLSFSSPPSPSPFFPSFSCFIFFSFYFLL